MSQQQDMDAVDALVEAMTAYFDEDYERADDAAKLGLSKIRQAKAGDQS